MLRAALVSLALLAPTAAAAAPPAVTLDSLVTELTDLYGLARFPSPPFTCRQFSSYDRASTSAANAETWFANADAGHYLRVEERDGRKEHVLADMQGPGAVVRIWSANPKGTLRFYVDGAEQPVLQGAMTDLLGGRVPGIPAPIAGERSRGWNLYLPIPYARSCKITSDEGGFYYHVNYRTYPDGTVVESFGPDSLARSSTAIYAAAGALAFPERFPRCNTVRETVSLGRDLPAGQRAEAEISGPGAIVDLSATLEAADRTAALRHALLRIAFDGEPTVEAPLADFFGGGPQADAYASLPFVIDADGKMRCRWVMPFRERAVVSVENIGAEPIAVRLEARVDDHAWVDGESMYFHATWNGDTDVPTRPMIDWNYLRASGGGAFVGAAFSICNPVKQWWGEGDEKIYVDGETFPSHFGTGTEDYYGYAWCCPDRFTHAYHNQPRCDGPGNYGLTAINRWHLVDKIPFTRDFKFDMELWHWNAATEVSMAVVAYWYGLPGARSEAAPVTAARVAYAPPPRYEPFHVAGAIEGETMAIREKVGNPAPQAIDGCSGEHHLWWRGAKPGDALALEFAAPSEGRYRVLMKCMRAGDYGIHRITVNGETGGPQHDFYNPSIALSDEIELGEFNLRPSGNVLRVEAVGANEKAAKSYMFGLDYIRLEPVR